MVLGSVQNGTLYCRAAVILLYLSLILLQLLVKNVTNFLEQLLSGRNELIMAVTCVPG